MHCAHFGWLQIFHASRARSLDAGNFWCFDKKNMLSLEEHDKWYILQLESRKVAKSFSSAQNRFVLRKSTFNKYLLNKGGFVTSNFCNISVSSFLHILWSLLVYYCLLNYAHISTLNWFLWSLLNLYCNSKITGDWLENLRVISVSRLELYFTDLFLLEWILIFKYKSE